MINQKMKFSTLLIASSLFFSCSIFCQHKWSFTTNLIVDQGLHEYKNNLDNNPTGLSVIGLFNFPNSKVSVGIEVGVAMYYEGEYREDLTDRGYKNSYAVVSEDNCYHRLMAIVRYDLDTYGPLIIYGEFQAGGSEYFINKYYSTYDKEDPTVFISIPEENQTLGISWKVGAGVGVLFNFGMLRKEPKPGKISLDFNATIDSGSKATYKSVQNSDAVLNKDDRYYHSKTDDITYRFGFRYNF